MKNYLGEVQNELHKGMEGILLFVHGRMKNRMNDIFYLKLKIYIHYLLVGL